ncbi:MAG TPA: MerR family transcriptional regulator [Candidatus Eremiobacteraceae bacterium]
MDGLGATMQAGEFAKLAGVTVRTQHHYDRLGLLSPGTRSEAGYRLYGDADLAHLQHIAALKFLGLPLQRIKALLAQSPTDLAATLKLQRRLLSDKRSQIDAALLAIERAERAIAGSDGQPDRGSLRVILEVLTMHKNMEWVKKYYSDEQLADLATRDDPALRSQAEGDWAKLIADAEASLGEDPAGERGQAIAARWSELIHVFTGGDAGIRSGLQKLYADRANWPATFEKPYSDAVGAFIAKAMAARERNAG